MCKGERACKGDGMQGGRTCKGGGLQRRGGVQGHAMVMVMECEVGSMCKGMQGQRQGRGCVRVCEGVQQ